MTAWLIIILLLAGASILNSVALAILLYRQYMVATAMLNIVKGK
jgi:hypothetical protein